MPSTAGYASSLRQFSYGRIASLGTLASPRSSMPSALFEFLRQLEHSQTPPMVGAGCTHRHGEKLPRLRLGRVEFAQQAGLKYARWSKAHLILAQQAGSNRSSPISFRSKYVSRRSRDRGELLDSKPDAFAPSLPRSEGVGASKSSHSAREIPLSLTVELVSSIDLVSLDRFRRIRPESFGFLPDRRRTGSWTGFPLAAPLEVKKFAGANFLASIEFDELGTSSSEEALRYTSGSSELRLAEHIESRIQPTAGNTQ